VSEDTQDQYETVPAYAVNEGDFIDLEPVPKPYVTDEDREHIYAFELAEVVGVERETDDCVRIDFDSTSIGFPPRFELHRLPPEEGQ
jgi:hypothetical protein